VAEKAHYMDHDKEAKKCVIYLCFVYLEFAGVQKY